jgi:acetyl-CoA C-acetyltransferase
MPEGIKDKVAIIGMGCTKFGERWDTSWEDLALEAFAEAVEDAGIDRKDIEAAWLSTCFDEVMTGKTAIPLSELLHLPFIPVTRVENYCASGSEALRGACYGVASGAYDIALALGVEKLKDTGYGGLPALLGVPQKAIHNYPNFTAPGMFAMAATRYFARYGLSPEEGKRTLARISSKSHHNGTMCEKAHLRMEAPVETIMKAPIIAWPLGLYDCCGVSDGGAAAIVTRADMAKKFRADPVYIKSMQIAVTSGEEHMYTEYDGTHIEPTYRAGVAAFKEAGIKSPRGEISMMDPHDCFSITELMIYEDLQISPRGRAKEDIDGGFFDLGGKIPCQTDGGLKCFGHPIGASGLRMMYEEYKQLQGKCGPRQVKDPKIGLTHNLGGFPHRSIISVNIVGREPG